MKPNQQTYFLTIVTTEITGHDPEGYAVYREELAAIVSKQPGFMSANLAVDGNKTISLTYWESSEAMAAWGHSETHQEIKKRSHTGGWLKAACIEIAQVTTKIEIPPQNS